MFDTAVVAKQAITNNTAIILCNFRSPILGATIFSVIYSLLKMRKKVELSKFQMSELKKLSEVMGQS